jgi:hypothetical protein
MRPLYVEEEDWLLAGDCDAGKYVEELSALEGDRSGV